MRPCCTRFPAPQSLNGSNRQALGPEMASASCSCSCGSSGSAGFSASAGFSVSASAGFSASAKHVHELLLSRTLCRPFAGPCLFHLFVFRRVSLVGFLRLLHSLSQATRPRRRNVAQLSSRPFPYRQDTSHQHLTRMAAHASSSQAKISCCSCHRVLAAQGEKAESRFHRMKRTVSRATTPGPAFSILAASCRDVL